MTRAWKGSNDSYGRTLNASSVHSKTFSYKVDRQSKIADEVAKENLETTCSSSLVNIVMQGELRITLLLISLKEISRTILSSVQNGKPVLVHTFMV